MFVVRKFIILCQYLLLACLLFVGHAKKCNQKRTILDSKIQECCLTRGGGIPASLNFNDDYDREYTSGISFGKDRELFHITVDLKWIFSRLTNKQNWLQLLQMGVEKIKRLYPPYDIWCSYRESALKIIRLIRKQDKKSSLRVFQSSLLHGQYFSTVLDRPILLYIEDSLVVDDGIVVPSLETLLLRKALTNHFVEDLINEKFLFVATTANHVYAETVIKLAQKQEKLSRNQPLEYPLFILLAPKLSAADYFPVSKEKSKPDADQAHHYSNPLQTIKFKKSLELEILFLFRPTSTLTAEQLRYLLLKVLKQFYEARQEEYETYLEAMMNGAKPPPSASTPAAFKGVDSIQFEGLKNEASHSSS